MATRKIQRFPKLSFLIAGAGLILATASATAAPQSQAYPSQGWEIAKSIPVDAAFSGEVCTIMAGYNNGAVLSLSGQGPHIQSITIDFGQPVFEDGKPYSVVLSVPGAFNATVPGAASPAQMLDINLQDKGDFYTAIKKIGVMDLVIEGQEHRFFLTGFHAASSRFESCTKALDVPISEPQTQQAASPAAQETSPLLPPLDVPAEIQTSANPLPEKKPAYFEESPSLPKPGPRPYRRLSEQLAAEMEQQNQQNGISLAVIEDEPMLKGPEVAEIMTPMPFPGALAAQDMEEETKAEIAAIKEGKKPREAVTVVEPVVPVIEQPEIVSFKTPGIKVTKKTGSGVADFTDVEPSASSTDMPPVQEISAVPVIPPGAGAKDLARLENEINRLITQNERLQNDNQALNTELSAALNAPKEHKASIETNNWNLERATMRYNEAERQLERMGTQLQQLRTQCEQEKKSLEQMLFDPALTSQSQIATLSSLEEQLKAAERHIRELEARLAITQR